MGPKIQFIQATAENISTTKFINITPQSNSVKGDNGCIKMLIFKARNPILKSKKPNLPKTVESYSTRKKSQELELVVKWSE